MATRSASHSVRLSLGFRHRCIRGMLLGQPTKAARLSNAKRLGLLAGCRRVLSGKAKILRKMEKRECVTLRKAHSTALAGGLSIYPR